MENFDSLFGTQPEELPEQSFDKEAWAEKKQSVRAELYEMIDEMADRTLCEPDMLATYLRMQARLGKMSVANTLLVAAKKPDASTGLSGIRRRTEASPADDIHSGQARGNTRVCLRKRGEPIWEAVTGLLTI